MNRTAIFYTSCLLLALPAIVCSAADRDRAYQRPATTVLQQASPSVVVPSGTTNNSQQSISSNDRGSRNNRTPSQGSQSVQSPPVVDLNDLQAVEFPGIQTVTIVSLPSLFDSETTEQKKPEETQEQQEEITDTPQQEEVVSSESDQPEATETGAGIAIGYYSSEPPSDQEQEVVSQL